MKVRLFDIIDLTRPLAKAARDLDWTEVVSLFPDASQEGMAANKIWVLASIVVLGEVTGLSEGEVLTRWPENPYWQAFSGFEQFQWQIPVTQADCVAFRRFITPKRAARLTQIAESIRDSKPIKNEVTSTLPQDSGSSVDEALALRQVHFINPLPAAPYKAPPRPDFHSSIRHTYAKSAAAPKAESEKTPTEPKTETAAPPSAASKDTVPGSDKNTPTKTAVGDDKSKEKNSKPAKASPAPEPAPLAPSASAQSQTSTPPANPPDPPREPTVSEPARSYAQLFRKKGILPDLTPKKSSASLFGAPVLETKPTLGPGAPQFDDTAPLVLRVPVGEPTRMEVSVTGEAPLRYQWEQWDDIKGISTPIEGCTDPSLTVALEPEDGMLAFQCRVSNRVAPEGIVSRTFLSKKAYPPKKHPTVLAKNLIQKCQGSNPDPENGDGNHTVSFQSWMSKPETVMGHQMAVASKRTSGSSSASETTAPYPQIKASRRDATLQRMPSAWHHAANGIGCRPHSAGEGSSIQLCPTFFDLSIPKESAILNHLGRFLEL